MKTIMLVDDDDISNFVIQRLIAKVSLDLIINVYNNPINAFNDLNLINHDIIFLDYNMPEMNGVQFLQAMLEQRLHHTVFIISSSVDSQDKIRVLKYNNVKHFLSKPISLEKLSKIIYE